MQNAYTETFQKTPEIVKFCTPVSSVSFCSEVIAVPNKMTETVPGERRVIMSFFKQNVVYLHLKYSPSLP